jgi:hypothetical protein
MEAGNETRPPRGALAVIAVGLIATVAAALLSTDQPIGAAELSWEDKAPLPDSRPAAIPGGGAMRLTEAGIRVSALNVSGYRLYRVAAVLKIGAGSAVGQGRVRCTMQVPRRAIVAQTPGSRASYPRSSEELIEQEVPEKALVEFSSNGTDLATVGLGDAFGSFADERGIVVEWAPFRLGQQIWQWGLPAGRPGKPLKLGFATIWRATGTPVAQITCTVETGAGTATVRTTGTLAG